MNILKAIKHNWSLLGCALLLLLPIAIFAAPINHKGIDLLCFLCAGALAVLCAGVYQSAPRLSQLAPFLWPGLVFSTCMAVDFVILRGPSLRFAAVAALLRMQPHTFLVLAAAAGAILGAVGLALLLHLSCQAPQTAQTVLWVLLVSALEYAQVEHSLMREGTDLLFLNPVYYAANAAVPLMVNLALVLLLRRWKPTLLISAGFFTLWSVANYYTMQFHGGPLFFSELANAGTALGVISRYQFRPSWEVIRALGVLSAEVVLICQVQEEQAPALIVEARLWMQRFAGLLACVVFTALFLPKSLVDEWHWGVSAKEFGFFACVASDLKTMRHPYLCPEDYDPEQLHYAQPVQRDIPAQTPDIILILNESFCDLDVYSSIAADTDYLSAFYDLDNAVYGHAVVPSIGGGTNNSEFELLTSHSLKLVNFSAPFNYIDFQDMPANLVQYLKALDYVTTAMHCDDPGNYSRARAYPSMGFDTVLLGPDAFSYVSSYGNREWTDADNYRDLLDHYDADSAQPQFLYLLTLQNHGSYEQNGPEWDTVHTTRDFGALTEEVNEYCTSLQQSAQAFRQLTDYFTQVDRPVLVCMVGDHAPAFISDLPSNRDMTQEETDVAQRVVPYVMWANYDVDLSCCTVYSSMTDLMPQLLDAAGLPLSAYYQTLLELHDAIPVRTKFGVYLDQQGNVHTDDADLSEAVRDYECLEYHALCADSGYRAELFLPETP